MEKPHLSLIFPAYKEEDRIGRSLKKTLAYLATKDYTCEIIVVDDGSPDNTAEVASSFGSGIKVVRLETNSGKGAAVRRGMLEARGEIRLFSDADLSTPIEEFDKIRRGIIDGADVSIGSRAIDPSMIKERQPFYREFMGKTFNRFVQIVAIKGIKDTQCGFKAFTAEAAEKIFSVAKINGFAFDVEALYLAQKFGMKIEQTPVLWLNDERSTVDPIKDSFFMLIELLKVKRLHRDVK